MTNRVHFFYVYIINSQNMSIEESKSRRENSCAPVTLITYNQLRQPTTANRKESLKSHVICHVWSCMILFSSTTEFGRGEFLIMFKNMPATKLVEADLRWVFSSGTTLSWDSTSRPTVTRLFVQFVPRLDVTGRANSCRSRTSVAQLVVTKWVGFGASVVYLQSLNQTVARQS